MEQGLTLQVPKTAAEPLPLPLQKPAALDAGISQSEHQFILQPNTTGMTQKVKRRILPELKPLEPVPILPKPTVFLQTQPADPSTEFLVTEETLKRKIPYSTERNKRKKLEKEAAGLYTRSYNKSAQCRRCPQCGKDVKSVGHVDYFKNIYCPENSDLTVEEWKAPLRLKYARNK